MTNGNGGPEFGPDRRRFTVTITGIANCDPGEEEKRARHIKEAMLAQLGLYEDEAEAGELSIDLVWGEPYRP